MAMTRFQFHLPDDQKAGLEQLADKTGSSAASLVRLAIAQMLDSRAEPAGR
jgi:predicted transcriptional regulator